MSEALAEAGANLVVCSRKLEACEETAEALVKLGRKALALPLDVSSPEQVAQVVNTTMAEFHSLDIVVNNSGASWGAPAVDMPIQAWHKVMEVNVTGTFLMSQQAARVMIPQHSGKIINIASVAGLRGSNPRALDAVGYSTSKGAIIALTRDLAVKWGPLGIQVNAIAPGFFPTKMSRAIIEKNSEFLLESTPLKRFGAPDDIKGIAVLLASKASDYMTGAIIVVDGGQSA
jgi:gluconate 5-dehydrogenase